MIDKLRMLQLKSQKRTEGLLLLVFYKQTLFERLFEYNLVSLPFRLKTLAMQKL